MAKINNANMHASNYTGKRDNNI